MDHELIARAHRLLRDRYVPNRHAVAAAVRTHDGRMFTGLHLGATVARVSVCAEAVALGQAIMAEQAQLAAIAAVHHAGTPSAATTALVSPCGMCRDLLSDYAPTLQVILPGEQGEPASTTISELLPRKFVRPSPESS